MNEVYKKAYTIYKDMSRWIVPDPFGMSWFMQGHLNSKFDARFQRDLEVIHKQLFPKKKKVNLLDIPEEHIEPVKAKYLATATKYVEVKRRQFDLLRKWLNENAPNVVLEADWQIVYSSDFGTYNSQTSPGTYTSGNCKKKGVLLDKLGIPYEVKLYWVDKDYNITLDGRNKEEYHYGRYYSQEDWLKKPKGHVLYAPLEPFMLDAIERMNTESLFDWAVNCWRSGVNPKVLNPFLPDDIFEKSSDVVYGGE